MRFYYFIGKVLFVAFFVYTGSQMLHNTEVMEKQLFIRYERLYEWCSSIGKSLPIQLSPSTLKPNFPTIILAIGASKFVLSALIVFNVQSFNLILSAIVIVQLALYCPAAAVDRKEYYSLLNQCAVNLGILGISLLLFGKESLEDRFKKPMKKREAAQEFYQQQQQQQDADGDKKKIQKKPLPKILTQQAKKKN